MMQERYIRPDADGQLAQAAENCRRALADDGSAALAAPLGADAPATPEGWFDLLARYPDRHSYDTMIRLKDLPPSDARSALVRTWSDLRSEEKVRALSLAVRSAS